MAPNTDPPSGLFSLTLSPFVRTVPSTTWVQIHIPITTPDEGPVFHLEYTAQAIINREGLEAISSYLRDASALEPSRIVEVSDALARALPAGSVGRVVGDGVDATFQSPPSPAPNDTKPNAPTRRRRTR